MTTKLTFVKSQTEPSVIMDGLVWVDNNTFPYK